MNYETVKSFILFVLIGVSFLLSFILWSYQPNYDYFRDTNYVNESDVGGQEKTKNELVEPIKIVFKNGEDLESFIEPERRRSLYKDMASWVMTDHRITRSEGRPHADQFVELVFPTMIPAELLTNLFTFSDEINLPDWSFDRVFMVLDRDAKSIQVIVLSEDQDRQLTARIDKTEIFQLLQSYIVDENELLHDNIVVGKKSHPIYIPRDVVVMPKKTVTATDINSDSFINALFRNPSLVTINKGEAYFTDGQRGMRIAQNNRKLEFINPLQSDYQRLTAMELIEKSVNKINEHKGWTNNFMYDSVNLGVNNIRYRLTYDGYPVFDQYQLSVIEQEWREQELYQYNRPLIQIGNLLNSKEVQLSSGEEVKSLILADKDRFSVDSISDIRIGYYMNYIEGTHSLILEPNWFIIYKNDWVKLDIDDLKVNQFRRGEG